MKPEIATNEVAGLRDALQRIKSELGVPGPEYPANVTNAYRIATAALLGESAGEQAPWDPQEHEHINGIADHNHPHAEGVHMNFDGLVGRGEDTGSTVLKVPGVPPAIVGENPDAT